LIIDENEEHINDAKSDSVQDSSTSGSRSSVSNKDGKKRKQLRTKKSTTSGDDEPLNGDSIVSKDSKRVKIEKKSEEISSEEKAAKDAVEVAEFDERLREKDKAKTKKKDTEPKGSKKAQEESDKRLELAKSVSNATSDRNVVIDELRTVSRQEYLVKREPQKLLELKLAIQDEEYLFKDEKLSESEKRANELQDSRDCTGKSSPRGSLRWLCDACG